MAYGTILKACRERKGFSQAKLADELHVDQADISRFENGKKEPSMLLFQKWASVTQSQDVLVAFIAGMDGLTILADVLSATGGVVAGVIHLLY